VQVRLVLPTVCLVDALQLIFLVQLGRTHCRMANRWCNPHTCGCWFSVSACAVQSLKRVIERFWWDRLRQPDTIRSLLQLVYARPSAIDDQVGHGAAAGICQEGRCASEVILSFAFCNRAW